MKVKVTVYNMLNSAVDANINVHKSHTAHFALALTMSNILTFQMFDLKNLGKKSRSRSQGQGRHS